MAFSRRGPLSLTPSEKSRRRPALVPLSLDRILGLDSIEDFQRARPSALIDLLTLMTLVVRQLVIHRRVHLHDPLRHA